MAGYPSSFLALPVEVGPWHDALVRSLPPRVRALHPADVHITLAFLSGVAPERAHAAWEAIAAIPIAPIEVRLHRMVPMGPSEGWTALSATLTEGHDALAEAMLAVRDSATDAAGARRETRPPLPHVTLARLHAKATNEEREAATEWAASLSLDHVVLSLRERALYTGRRERPPGQPAYEIVQRAPLLEVK